MSGRPTLPETDVEQEQQTKRQPPYHVILLNDDDHTYEYVIEMLKALFGHPVEKGFQLAKVGGHAGAGDRLHDEPGAGGAEARPDPRLRPRPADPALPGADDRRDRTGRVNGETRTGGQRPARFAVLCR